MMTPEQHKQRHIELHAALDELVADYITHEMTDRSVINSPLKVLLTWAYAQTQELTHIDGEHIGGKQ